MNISVCIATYNGEKYILEQIKSILAQLDENDEIVIVDDCSRDETVALLESLNDNRILIHLNSVNKGHVYSFGKALALSTKDFIFMADQDDIWPKDRINILLNGIINSNKMLLTANSSFVDKDGNSLDYHIEGVKAEYSELYFKNIFDIFLGKMNYYGCVMVMQKKFKKIILPFPNFVESHDLWIAQASNLCKSNIHINDIALYRRVHNSNASLISRKLLQKIYSRVIFLLSAIVIYKRIIFKN